jgi:hypothetical protein
MSFVKWAPYESHTALCVLAKHHAVCPLKTIEKTEYENVPDKLKGYDMII